MPAYDPQPGRRRPTEAAIDAVFEATPGNGAATDPGAEPADAVIDLSEPTDTGLSSPTVTPDPAPSNEDLLRLGALGTVVGLFGAAWLWRRIVRRRRSS